MKHRVRELLDEAAAGRFPPCDGEVEVVVLPPGLTVAAVFAFTAHHVIAADVAREEITRRLDGLGLSGPTSAGFLTWLGEQMRADPGSLDVLYAAGAQSGPPPMELVETDAFDSHPRVQRADRYRVDLRTFGTAEGDCVLSIGRGVCGRFEAAFEVDPAARDRGLGRQLAVAARHLASPGEAVFLQVAPGNAASLRVVVGAGYRPIGGEVLFWR